MATRQLRVLSRTRSSFFVAFFLGAVLASGCLTILAPGIEPMGPHAGLESNEASANCLTCHRLESYAMKNPHELIIAPLVMDWMIQTPETCIECHQLVH